MEKNIEKASVGIAETRSFQNWGAEKSNSGLITAGMLLYSKTELSEARGQTVSG